MKVYMPITTDDEHYALFTDKSLADTVLKLFKMKYDEESEIKEYNTDENASEFKAGLLPWTISIELLAGRIVGQPEVELCWPPLQEGVINKNDGLIQYFCFAKSPAEAIRRIPSLKKDVSQEAPVEVEA